MPAGEDAGMFFEGFAEARVGVGAGIALRVRTGGSGPPVVLLHGHPRTHTTWHRVAPQLLAAGHTVVCPDLRGYGQSSKPETTADHTPYSKRAMAGDMLTLMRRLGPHPFAVAGHHYALVDVVGLEPGVEVPYEVRLDGGVTWPAATDDTTATTPAPPPPTIRPWREGDAVRVLAGSCRQIPSCTRVKSTSWKRVQDHTRKPRSAMAGRVTCAWT